MRCSLWLIALIMLAPSIGLGQLDDLESAERQAIQQRDAALRSIRERQTTSTVSGSQPGADRNPSDMSLAEYAGWISRLPANHPIRDDFPAVYDLLTHRRHLRGLTIDHARRAAYLPEDLRVAEQWRDEFAREEEQNIRHQESGRPLAAGIKIYHDNGHLKFPWNSTKINLGTADGHTDPKGYLTLSCIEHTHHRYDGFRIELAKAGFNGQVKWNAAFKANVVRFDTIVVHGRTTADIDKAETVALRVYGRRFAERGWDAFGKSYSQILERTIQLDQLTDAEIARGLHSRAWLGLDEYLAGIIRSARQGGRSPFPDIPKALSRL